MSRQSELAALGRVSDTGALSNRNLIINGAMQVAQRGTSTSITHQQAEFVTDRFQTYEGTAGSLDVEQSTTAPDGFYYSTKWTVTSADTSLASGEQAWVRQRVEGYNMAHLGWGTSAAQTVTLSFWVRSSVTGTFAGSFQNSAGDRAYPYTYTISSADTWEYKQVTLAGDTAGTWLKTNGNGCTIYWSFGMATNLQGTAGAWAASSARTASGETQLIATNSATFYITGVQLEVGDTATEFEHRSYGDELARCQRYYEILSNTGANSTPASYSSVGGGKFYCTPMTYAVTKRATPTATIDGGSAYWTIPGIQGYGASGTKTWGTVGLDATAVTPYANHVSGNATPVNAYVYRWEATLEVILDAEL